MSTRNGNNAWTASIASCLLLTGNLWSEEGIKYTANGYGNWHFGQVVHGHGKDVLKDQWIGSLNAGLKFEAHPSERLTINISPEMKLFFPVASTITTATRRGQYRSYINEMNGEFDLGDLDSPFAEIKVGYFPYKYGPDSKDFGEYLFRTGTYPSWVINDFDFAKSRLCGANVRVNPLTDLYLDAILSTELQFYPLYDFSLSFLTGYKHPLGFDVGAGVTFARLFSVNSKYTDAKDTRIGAPKARAMQYLESPTDTATYSFRATKLMARASYDLKAVFPGLEILGPQAAKVYGEIALTAFPINTYPDSTRPELYDDYKRLMPMTFGINLPTWKIFDVLSFEMEYFPSRIPNDYHDQLVYNSTVPRDIEVVEGQKTTYDASVYKDRDLGWALYASKVVIPGVRIVGQAAYDHLRLQDIDGADSPPETMTAKKDWAWQAKTEFSF